MKKGLSAWEERGFPFLNLTALDESHQRYSVLKDGEPRILNVATAAGGWPAVGANLQLHKQDLCM